MVQVTTEATFKAPTVGIFQTARDRLFIVSGQEREQWQRILKVTRGWSIKATETAVDNFRDLEPRGNGGRCGGWEHS